jgi:PAS domain S-box-containing protein
MNYLSEHPELILDKLYSNNLNGVCLVSQIGNFLAANTKFQEIVGYTEEELKKLSFQDITYKDDLHIDMDLAARLLTSEIDEYVMHKRYVSKIGDIVWCLLKVSPVKLGSEFLLYLSQVQELGRIKANLESRQDRLGKCIKSLQAVLALFVVLYSYELLKSSVIIEKITTLLNLN